MMKRITTFLLFNCLLTICAIVKGQDAIYLFNGTSHPFRLSEGDDNVLKMTEIKGNRTIKRSLQRDSIAFVFNSKGAYLFMSEISTDPSESKSQLDLFYQTPPLKSGDILIKADPLQVITGVIQYEGPGAVNYKTTSGANASISKDELAAIIYSDGRHQLRMSPEESAFILSDALADMARPDDTHSTSEPQTAGFPTASNENNTGEKHNSGNVSESLDESTLGEFRGKGLQKVEEFVQYLNIISDQSIPSDEKDKAIEQTLTLFLPSATIQVTSVNRSGVRTFKIRDYLIRLKLLPYSATEISWHEINYIKELTQEADGAYYGTISGTQTFTGYSKNGEEVAYSDITQKEVKVKLQQYNKNVEGSGQLNWEVLLGNVGISVAQ